MRGLDQIIFGDQIIKVRGLFTNPLSRILAETGLSRLALARMGAKVMLTQDDSSEDTDSSSAKERIFVSSE